MLSLKLDVSSLGTEIWILDRRVHPGITRVVPTNVDLEARVRRERQEPGRPEVPLKSWFRFRLRFQTCNKIVAVLFQSLSGGCIFFRIATFSEKKFIVVSH